MCSIIDKIIKRSDNQHWDINVRCRPSARDHFNHMCFYICFLVYFFHRNHDFNKTLVKHTDKFTHMRTQSTHTFNIEMLMCGVNRFHVITSVVCVFISAKIKFLGYIFSPKSWFQWKFGQTHWQIKSHAYTVYTHVHAHTVVQHVTMENINSCFPRLYSNRMENFK